MKRVKWKHLALALLLGVAGAGFMPDGPLWREIPSAMLIVLATIICMDATEATP